MPIHIDELTSEVAAFEDDLPLTKKQLERIIRKVLERFEEVARDARYRERAVTFKTASDGPAPFFKG